MKRNKVDASTIELLKNKQWLENKLIVEQYSCSRLAKEIGTTRTTVEKYRVFHNIQQPLSQEELASISLQHKDKKQILEKRKQTNLQKYGAENTFQSHREQIKQIMKEKYGVEKPLQSDLFQKKKTATMLERYGVEHAAHNRELYQKQLNTILDLYGDNPARLDQFKEKAKQTCLEKYGVEHAMSNPEIALLSKQRFLELYTYDQIQQKAKQTNRERYGVDYAIQNPKIYEYVRRQFWQKYDTEEKRQSIRDNMQNTCNLKYGTDYASQSHLFAVLHLLNDRLWLLDQHHTQKKTLTQIASELGCDQTTVSRYCTMAGIRIKYYYESAQQRELSDWLSTITPIVQTNVRDIINGELDIYLPEHKLAIEYCGVFWHSDAHPRMTHRYHLNKLEQCQAKDIRLLTIYEDEWLYKKDIVQSKIRNILGQDATAVYARKCSIVNINKREKKQFYEANHIQGDGPGSITYGLRYGETVVAMMSFIQNKNGVFILNRYASSIRVVGGFQKLLNYFQHHNNWTQIVSFADLRWSVGDLYFKSGFILDKTLSPDYRYVIGNKTFHKFAFRRKALQKFLPVFDQHKTEVQNMRDAGYYRIWNCGLMRFVMNNIKV